MPGVVQHTGPARRIVFGAIGVEGRLGFAFNGGQTWSSIMNQPTAQFYRVITDDRFSQGWKELGTTHGLKASIPISRWR